MNVPGVSVATSRRKSHEGHDEAGRGHKYVERASSRPEWRHAWLVRAAPRASSGTPGALRAPRAAECDRNARRRSTRPATQSHLARSAPLCA